MREHSTAPRFETIEQKRTADLISVNTPTPFGSHPREKIPHRPCTGEPV